MSAEQFAKLAPFARRAGVAITGRERLSRLRKRLEFVLMTEDLSENSRKEILGTFRCPIITYLTSTEVDSLFGFRGTRVVGFKKSALARSLLQAYRAQAARGDDDMEGERSPRVAVLGVGGIGKHHAKWWHLEGADVVAFLGRSTKSVAEASATLAARFDFEGTGYTDLAELLRRTKPDIVDVCTPTECHFMHAGMALEAGCHVLCEKPLVYDRRLSDDVMLAQGRELIALAEAKGLRFGVCTQYVAATRNCLAMRPDLLRPISSYQGYLVSPIRGRSPDPARTWVDLAPHMLGALQAACPDGRIDWKSLALDFEQHQARATFQLRRADGGSVDAEIFTNHTEVEPRNVRRLTFNGYTFDIGGFNDEQGVFQARIHTPDGDEDREDAMRLLIRQFKEGSAAVPGTMALQNLEWMLRILALGR